MKSWWLLLSLLATPCWVLPHVRLEESGPGVVKPSETLTLSCSVTGYPVTTTYSSCHWIRQPLGKSPQWLGYMLYDGTTNYDPSVESRMSISRDTLKNEFSLQLNGMTSADTAVYYCAVGGSRNSGDLQHWGRGIMVTVSSATKTTPTVFPLSAYQSNSEDPVSIGCLVTGYFPEPVEVTWNNQNKDGSTARTFPAVLESSGYYVLSSLLVLPADQCPESKAYQCKVNHYGSSRTANVDCKRKNPGVCPDPCPTVSVSLLPPSLDSLFLDKGANLTCELTGVANVQGANFSWSAPPSVTAKPVRGPAVRDGQGKYTITSTLEVCTDEWMQGHSFSCTVTHPELREPITKTIAKTSGPLIRPAVHLLPPTSEELALNEMATLTCLVRGFSPRELLVKWMKGGQEVPRTDYVTGTPQQEISEGSPTFFLYSTLRVQTSSWKSGENFSCVVGHESLPLNFTQKTFDQSTGKPSTVNLTVVMSDAAGTCY
nr:immunoglobulin A heavy chain [Tachyglossus aculeatus]